MKTKYPSVTIVVPVYRAEYYIKDFIKNISNIDYPNFRVLMVCDPSPDATLEIAKKLTKEKRSWDIVINKKRLGISKSLNLGIKKSKSKYVAFFMTDEFVKSDCVNKLVEYIENADRSVGVVVAKTYDFHKRDRIQVYRMYLMPQTGFLYIPEYGLKDNKRYNEPFEGFSGIDGTLFKKEVFKKAGMFDTDIDLSVNDLDMVWRTWLAGYRIVKVPSAKIYHWSLKVGRGDTKWEFTYAKMLSLFIQNYSIKFLIIYLPQFLIIYTGRSFLMLLLGNMDPLKGWVKAIIWSLTYLPKALKKRRIIQNKVRSVSDEYLYDKIFGKLSIWSFYKHVRWVQKTITPILITKEATNEKILTYTK